MISEKADLRIFNGTILTMDRSNPIIENGMLLIKGDTISHVGKAKDLSHIPSEKEIDARNGWIMPGLINTHTHAAMTLFRGLADDLPLNTWLNDHIFPQEAALDEDKVFKSALLAMAEMILSGTTTFCDMYLFEDAVAKAPDRAGLRGVLGEVLFDFPSPNYGPLENGFAYTERLIEKWHGHPLITIAIEPHSPYLCSPELLKRSVEISQTHQIPFVIHLAETQFEVDTIQSRYQTTPVGHLANVGALFEKVLACHCVFLSDEDIQLLSRHHVKVAHNPESNMKLASGIADIPKLLENGITVGLGTDGCASNNNLDMLQEMNTASKLQKVNRHTPTALPAATTLQMATIEGAKALGLEDKIGSLEPGKSADVIVIDRNKPHLTPTYHPVSHIVYAASGSDVSSTIVGGKILMEDRQLKTLDIKRVMADINSIAKGLKL